MHSNITKMLPSILEGTQFQLLKEGCIENATFSDSSTTISHNECGIIIVFETRLQPCNLSKSK